MTKPRLFACIVLFAVAMEAVNYGAHQIVGTFGWIGGFLTAAAIVAAAYWHDHRAARR